MLPLLLLACAAPEPLPDPGPEPAPLTTPTGTCPDLSSPGEVTFTSNGQERTAWVALPDEHAPGMPVLVVYHGSGDTGARSLRAYLRLEALAREAGMVVVTPFALPSNLLEWEFRSDGPNDLPMWDDLRACLAEQLEVDLRRYAATGFSAGALWTSFLVMHRADTLSTALAFSGGSEPLVTYERPDHDLPVMLMWGGEDDTWGAGAFTVAFEPASRALADALVDDGHLVVGCDHGLGHTLPIEARDTLRDWTLGHVFGEPSPWAEHLDGLPDYCGREGR